MVICGKVDLVSTTNLDDLVQAGVHSIDSSISIKTISSVVSNSVGFSLNEGFPNIIKLHGDHLFDKLKNTALELQKLEDEIYDAIGKHTATVITNALPAVQFPRKCYVFSSSITTWKELRATTNNSCVAILYKGKVWALGSKSGILEAFADKNINNIEEMDISI